MSRLNLSSPPRSLLAFSAYNHNCLQQHSSLPKIITTRHFNLQPQATKHFHYQYYPPYSSNVPHSQIAIQYPTYHYVNDSLSSNSLLPRPPPFSECHPPHPKSYIDTKDNSYSIFHSLHSNAKTNSIYTLDGRHGCSAWNIRLHRPYRILACRWNIHWSIDRFVCLDGVLFRRVGLD